MTSLKRTHEADALASNISSKVYVRSTRSGKVQKIVREVYLRTDIPCSSKLCKICLQDAPRNAAQEGESPVRLFCHAHLTDFQSSRLSSRTSQQAPKVFHKAITWSPTLTLY